MAERAESKAGIDPMGDLSWGTHLCLFYETLDDLIATNSDYLGAGLENGDFCLWALSDPVTREDAIKGLRQSIPEFDSHLEAGHIELIASYKFYLQGGEFDSRRIIGRWHAKLAEASKKGFAGMRVSGNAFWLESNLWKEFRDYEADLNRAVEGRNMMILCTYPLYESRSVDLLDVARTHQFSVAKRQGRWEFLETPELAETRRQIARQSGALDILSSPFPGHDQMTLREQLVLTQIVKGASSKEGARVLGISPRTVEFHRANIMRKLGVRNVGELLGKLLAVHGHSH